MRSRCLAAALLLAVTIVPQPASAGTYYSADWVYDTWDDPPYTQVQTTATLCAGPSWYYDYHEYTGSAPLPTYAYDGPLLTTLGTFDLVYGEKEATTNCSYSPTEFASLEITSQDYEAEWTTANYMFITYRWELVIGAWGTPVGAGSSLFCSTTGNAAYVSSVDYVMSGTTFSCSMYMILAPGTTTQDFHVEGEKINPDSDTAYTRVTITTPQWTHTYDGGI